MIEYIIWFIMGFLFKMYDKHIIKFIKNYIEKDKKK